jgi:hypothetical protein
MTDRVQIRIDQELGLGSVTGMPHTRSSGVRTGRRVGVLECGGAPDVLVAQTQAST